MPIGLVSRQGNHSILRELYAAQLPGRHRALDPRRPQPQRPRLQRGIRCNTGQWRVSGPSSGYPHRLTYSRVRRPPAAPAHRLHPVHLALCHHAAERRTGHSHQVVGGGRRLWPGARRGRCSRGVADRPGRTHRAGADHDSAPRRGMVFVATTFDTHSAQVAVYQEPLRAWPQDQTRATATATTQIQTLPATRVDCVMAGLWQTGENGEPRVGRHLNGKIDRRDVPARPAPGRITLAPARRIAAGLWRRACRGLGFSAEVASDTIIDTSPHGFHGRTVNLPARAMTGYNWSGQEADFRHAPHEYGRYIFMTTTLRMPAGRLIFAGRCRPRVKAGCMRAGTNRGGRRPHPFLSARHEVRPARILPFCSDQ